MSALAVANVQFESTSSNRMDYISSNSTIRIKSTGGLLLDLTNGIVSNVGIGIAPAYKLHVDGDIYATGDITAFSDVAIKENIQTIIDPVEKVMALRGVTYTRKDTKEDKIGLIAQEVREVLPELVIEKEGNIGVAYQNMVALLIEAVKELKSEIEVLKNK